MMKNKKLLLIISLTAIVILLLISIALQPSVRKTVFQKTIPLLPSPTPSVAISMPRGTPNVPPATNISNILKRGDTQTAEIERQKIASNLPIRINDYETSLKQKTTINIFTLPSDPKSLLHIEIYGINYNHPEIDQSDAIAFRESFLLAKKALTSRGINLKNLRISFGNRQYIQDTALYWITAYKLLD